LNQLRELEAELPWRLTLGQFLERITSEYGFEVCGREERDPYLKSPDGHVVHLPGLLQENDQLDETVTGSLCRRLRVPPEDFGLMPEEPFDDDPEGDD
jgi:hypothetical protein